jgi:integral membrane sensor domain MASE1
VEVRAMVLWWIANAIGLFVVIPLVLLLSSRVLKVATQISHYADDILEHGVGITAALEPLPALNETAALARTATGHAVAYVTVLDRAS